jgi:hypothetical protein
MLLLSEFFGDGGGLFLGVTGFLVGAMVFSSSCRMSSSSDDDSCSTRRSSSDDSSSDSCS